MQSNLSIKSWAEDDRPREKLILKGKHNLSDSELLAIIIGSGNKQKSAIDLAKELLNSVSNDLGVFAKLSVDDLKKFNGVGEAKAISIIAALEFGKRRKEIQQPEKVKLTSSSQVYTFIENTFLDLIHEEFHVVLLNRANQFISIEHISSGGFSSTVVDAKIVFKKALEKNAHAMILCHNHPSGQLKPSIEDITLTKNLREFSKILDISILDHIIFTDNGYFSFADEGILN